MLPTSPNASQQVGVVILAAGASRRMGMSKPLLKWENGTILEHIVRQWQDLGVLQVAVVFDPGQPAIIREMDRLGITARIPNTQATRGMFSSVRAAAGWSGWTPNLKTIGIALVDQPHISTATLAALLAFCAENGDTLCQPEFCGRHGHPVLLPATSFRQIADTTLTSLKDWIASQPRSFLDCDDSGICSDLDYPHDYRNLTARQPTLIAA